MDSFEWNKIVGAVLFALLVSFGLGIFSETFFSTEAPETPGYVIALATEAGSESSAAAPAEQPIAALLAAADSKAGANSAKKCGVCHTFDAGGANKVGPNLYGVVNRPIASHEGYEYDDAMKTFAQAAGTWTFEHLNTFLHNPKGTVPGTKMAFAGLKNDSERANVIDYLRTLSDNPAPLPEPPTDAAATESETETQVASAAPASTAEAMSAPAAEMPAAEAPAAEAAAPSEEAPAQQMAAATPAEEPAAPAEEKPMAAMPAEEPAPAATMEAPAEQQTAQTEAPASPAADAGSAAGDVAKGEAFAKRCGVCHDLTPAAVNKVGPHLFGVVGRPIASAAGFKYSDAMKEFSENGSKVWDEATLDTYLSDPRKVVVGTKMVFPGIKAEADRQNLIAYLKTLAE